MAKKIGLIGSTGSIGVQTLDVIRHLNSIDNREHFEIIALAAGTRVEELALQAREFNVKNLYTKTKDGADFLKKELYDIKPNIFYGNDGLVELAKIKMDTLITAVVGMIGLQPTYEAVKLGTDIALANKETLVAGGEIIVAEAAKSGSKILPVDSEHSAIFQCLEGNRHEDVEKLILTASGGPFRNYSTDELEKVTLEETLKHPTWNMGGKITIDCASLMNKGLEVIEASWLFGLSTDKVDVVVHPQSIIHSMVQYKDGSVLSQMGNPDMKVPIQLALTYPIREHSYTKRLNLTEIKSLTFEKPDRSRFPCLELAYQASKIGGTMPAVMNAANEVAVEWFMKGRIYFTQIPTIIDKTMQAHTKINKPQLETILECDSWARNFAGGLL